MQYVRCEACGAKAILAASRCPKCAHPLELRDHHGEFVPLTHCRKCDTWYPTSRGSCKGCGTTPTSRSPSPLYISVGAVFLAAAGWWVFGRSPVEPHERTVAAAEPVAAAIPSVPGVVVTPPPAADSVVDTVAATASPPDIDTAIVDRPEIAQPRHAPAGASLQSPATASFARTGYAMTTTWINLRGDPDRTGAIIGTIPPDTRVEAGARFRGWRQVRTKGLVGWVDPRRLVDDPSSPR